jgi:hypothetical protein
MLGLPTSYGLAIGERTTANVFGNSSQNPRRIISVPLTATGLVPGTREQRTGPDWANTNALTPQSHESGPHQLIRRWRREGISL